MVLLVKGGTVSVYSYRNLNTHRDGAKYTALVGDESRPKQAERALLSVLLFLYKSNRNHYQVSALSYPHWHIRSHVLILVFCGPVFISSPSGFDLEAVGTRRFCSGLSVQVSLCRSLCEVSGEICRGLPGGGPSFPLLLNLRCT